MRGRACLPRLLGIVACVAAIGAPWPALAASAAGDHRVRRLTLKRDDIATVHTALGIATLIQVPDRPTSVVLGDTNAFKVEYLENAITIKPLGRNSKSNLYIYTEARRFNVSLVTEAAPLADYVVYLAPHVSPDPMSPKSLGNPAPGRWIPCHSRGSSNDLGITIDRRGEEDSLLLLGFTIEAKSSMRFQPGWIWVTQGKRTIPIESLSLSRVDLDPGHPTEALLTVKRAEVPGRGPLHLELRAKHPVILALPGPGQWMRPS